MQSILTKDVKLSPARRATLNPLPGFVSGSILKMVAVITMAIDHFAAGVLYYMLLMHRLPAGEDFERLYRFYLILRGIGRTAFPIYCFLLVEGLVHTRSRARYLGNLALFALLSELPFDLAVSLRTCADTLRLPLVLSENGRSLFDHQNVFFTLAIGLAAIWLIETLRERFGVCLLTIAAAVPASVLAVLLANVLNTDYHGYGVALILTFYFLRPMRIAAAGAGLFVITRLPLETFGFPGFLLMLFYNGRRGFLGRGRAAKYFFYAFYPVHFCVYVLIRVWLLNVL